MPEEKEKTALDLEAEAVFARFQDAQDRNRKLKAIAKNLEAIAKLDEENAKLAKENEAASGRK